MSGSNGVWILYIWIFLLVWRAVCVQGATHLHTRSRRSHGDSPTEHVMREDNVADHERDPPQTKSRQPTKHNPAPNDQTEREAAGSGSVAQGRSVNVPSPLESSGADIDPGHHVPKPLDSGVRDNVPEPLETVPMLANTTRHRGHNVKPLRLTVTVETGSNTSPPLDTGQPKSELSRTETPLSAQKHSKDMESTVEDEANEVLGTSPVLHYYGQVGNDSGTDTTGVVNSSDIETESKVTSTETRQYTPQKHTSTTRIKPSETSESIGKSGKQLKHKNRNSTRSSHEIAESPLNFVKYSDVMMDQNVNSSEQSKSKRLDRLSHVHEKNKQNLVLLRNTTEQADAIQKTLRTHKLKLKSYMEVLKNLTVQHAANRKLVTEYTHTVREKVSDILNPKRHLDNHTKPEKIPGQKPQHLLAKNISDTLRSRVDVQNLKKNEAFWDKRGEDVVEPHLLKDALHFENSMIGEDMVILGGEQTSEGRILGGEETSEGRILELDLVSEERIFEGKENSEERVLDAISESRDISEIVDDTQADLDTTVERSEVDDVHQARLDEIKVTRDRLLGRTGHENMIFNQVVSGRIHGNILAPPPERCSVQANMKRYRPPEEEMKEADSLFYRVDLQPEFDNALEGAPMDYLEDYKNPCWLSQITDNRGSLWYDYTESGLTYKRMSFLYEMRLSKDSNWRMRCLPLLFFVGVTKSGTTDLYTRLMGHPEVMRPAHKEPMWWNRLTLGMAQSLRKHFRYYVDFFDEAAELMRRKVVLKDGKPYHPGITVDATPANLWDYDCWTDIPGNRGLAEPKYTLAHSIRKLVPNARILLILREPTDRLYSQYRMKSHQEPSYTFHRQVLETIFNFNQCLQNRTLRSCAYDHDIATHEFGSPGGVFLRASLYYVFVKDWLEVFPREQVMVVRSEDYHNNTAGTLQVIFDFLGLSPLPAERLAAISGQRSVNTRADHLDRSLEPILPETQRLLDDFFRPYNKMLAKLLRDKRFKWNDVRGPTRK